MASYPWVFYPRHGRKQESRLAVTEASTEVAVALDDAKLHLRVDHDDEDDYITALIEAATSEIDTPRGWLGRSLMTRELRLTLDDYPPYIIYLPGPPIESIESVEYRDRDGVIQTLDEDEYETDLLAEPGLIWPARDGDLCRGYWPTDMQCGGPDLFRVNYKAGYGDDPSDLPRIIRQWILCRVGDMYRDREGSIIGTNATQLTHVERSLDGMRVR